MDTDRQRAVGGAMYRESRLESMTLPAEIRSLRSAVERLSKEVSDLRLRMDALSVDR
jgi:hypothetical protein